MVRERVGVLVPVDPPLGSRSTDYSVVYRDMVQTNTAKRCKQTEVKVTLNQEQFSSNADGKN